MKLDNKMIDFNNIEEVKKIYEDKLKEYPEDAFKKADEAWNYWKGRITSGNFSLQDWALLGSKAEGTEAYEHGYCLPNFLEMQLEAYGLTQGLGGCGVRKVYMGRDERYWTGTQKSKTQLTPSEAQQVFDKKVKDIIINLVNSSDYQTGCKLINEFNYSDYSAKFRELLSRILVLLYPTHFVYRFSLPKIDEFEKQHTEEDINEKNNKLLKFISSKLDLDFNNLTRQQVWAITQILHKLYDQQHSQEDKKKEERLKTEKNTSEENAQMIDSDYVQTDNETCEQMLYPLNLVLYGPPGTGKTYNSIIRALEIIAQKDAKTQKAISEYNKKQGIKERQAYYQKELVPLFNKFKRNGQIKFITFHQNYCYEDFIESIRPTINESASTQNISYQFKDGIFKEISDDALLSHIDFDKAVETFEDILSQFKEKYQVGDEIEAKQSSFKIVDFLDKSIRIRPQEGNNTYSISYAPLKQAYLKDKQKTIQNASELSTIMNGYQGLSSYYFAILQELNKIKTRKSAPNIVNQHNKKRILESYYAGERHLLEEGKPYILIIDEINRGNISKIFGELITLIEPDKRIGKDKLSLTTELPYTREKFGVPDNLYIIGTMNTADKSIALVDVALRRRFKFEEMEPDETLITDPEVREVFHQLNEQIEDEDHKIGHSYFINKSEGDLQDLWKYEIMPLIREYFYGDEDKIKECTLDKINERIKNLKTNVNTTSI